jgi:hypothetical protein
MRRAESGTNAKQYNDSCAEERKSAVFKVKKRLWRYDDRFGIMQQNDERQRKTIHR